MAFWCAKKRTKNKSSPARQNLPVLFGYKCNMLAVILSAVIIA